jgi:hypothetical protein
MFCRLATSAAVAVALALAACSDQPQESSPDPQFKPGDGGSSTSCDFASLQGFIIGYFPGPQQSGIFSIRDDFVSETNSLTQVALGYQIMDSIGKTSRTASLSSSALTAGEDLTKGLIKCMFDASIEDSFPGFPVADVYDFERALDAAAGGAYYVRRETQSDAAPVFSVQSPITAQSILSGVAPPSGSDWTDVLNETALVYGWFIPGTETEPDEFEWATIRPTVVFDTEAVIALCVGNVPENTLVNESNIGFLAWQGTGGFICNPNPPYDPTLTLLESGWGPRALARRFTRWGSSALLPEPAFAAAVLATGGTGSAKTLRSKLKLGPVAAGALTLVSPPDIPPDPVERRGVEFIVRVRVTDAAGVGVNGQCVLATGFNNSGQTSTLNGESNCAAGTLTDKQMARLTETAFVTPGNPEAGYATFRITIPSSGAMIITFSGVNEDGDNLDKVINNSVTTNKFNVKP